MRLKARLPVLLGIILLVFSVNPASATPFLAYTSSSTGAGTLWDATDANNSVSNPRPTVGGLIDIEFDCTGTLYGLAEGVNPLLYRINPLTGAATPIGSGTGLDFTFEGDMAYDPTSGLLYGFAELDTISQTCCVNLVTINTTTGVATPVAGVDFAHSFVSMMAFDSAGSLWIMNQATGGPTTLVQLNKTTGAVISEVSIFGDSTNLSDASGGMDFDPLTNTMFLANTVRWTINRNTGEITALFGGASFLPDVRGYAVVPQEVAAAVPEPGSLLLFGGGLAALAWRRRSRTRLGRR